MRYTHAGDAQRWPSAAAIAQKITPVIESSAQFSSFYNSLIVKHLWNVNFWEIGR